MNLPELFLRTLPISSEEKKEFVTALNADPPTAVRINPEKGAELFADLEKVPWAKDGRYLKARPSFIEDPLFHGGAYYVQEASSMALELAVKPFLKEGVRILDLCASPGGKSTHLLSMMPKSGFLVTNEVIRQRANILAENILKWGYPNVVVTNNEPEHFQKIGNQFDLILVDAPCSGEGMFRKTPEAVNEWSLNAVELCQARQRKIVASVLPALKPDGVLVYSTCTYNTKENEENTQWFANEFDLVNCSIDSSLHPAIKKITTNQSEGLKFFPHRTMGEGFFISVLQKKDSLGQALKKMKKVKAIFSKSKIAEKFFSADQHLAFIQDQNQNIFVAPEIHLDFLHLLQEHLYLLEPAFPLGQIIHNKIKYGHGAAMCKRIKIKEPINKVDLDKKHALTYLMRQDILLKDVPKGWVLFTYLGVSLGWGKNLGNRINNYYPSYFRIRKNIDLLTVLD